MSKHKEAPRLVNVGVWGGAVLGSLVLALSVGLYFYGLLNNPISADTSGSEPTSADQLCDNGKVALAINNYPGSSNLIDGHSPYYLSNQDMNFRCSNVCLDPAITANPTTGTVVLKNLENAKINGHAIKPFNTPNDFNNAIKQGGTAKEEAMKYGIIISTTRPVQYDQTRQEWTGCYGPNSVDYGSINSSDGSSIKMLDRSDTSYKPSSTENSSSNITERDNTGESTVAGSGTGDVGRTGDSGEGLSAPTTEKQEKASSNVKSKIENCLGQIREHINYDLSSENALNAIDSEYSAKRGNLDNDTGINLLTKCRRVAIMHYYRILEKKDFDKQKADEIFKESIDSIMSGLSESQKIALFNDMVNNPSYKSELSEIINESVDRSGNNATSTVVGPTQDSESEYARAGRIAGSLWGTAGGIGAGSITGAVIGSALGPIGTIAGGIIGGTIGGGAGYIAGGKAGELAGRAYEKGKEIAGAAVSGIKTLASGARQLASEAVGRARSGVGTLVEGAGNLISGFGNWIRGR